MKHVYTNIKDTIEAYYNGGTDVRNPQGNVYSQGNKLYSYGSHFILAVNLGNNYLINGDRYSNSTSRHTNYCISILQPNFQIPFSALRSANISPDNVQLVEHVQDTWREEKYIDPKTKEEKTREVHYLGGVLFNYNGSQYLSGFDSQESFNRRAYYLSRLFQNNNSTYEEAIKNLQPKEVKEAIFQGLDVKRQGEMFFIPIIMGTNNIRRYTKLIGKMHPVLPNTNHIATDVREMINPDRKMYRNIDNLGIRLVRGTVRHVRGEHKMLKLGNIWHRVYKNTAIESFSASGLVD